MIPTRFFLPLFVLMPMSFARSQTGALKVDVHVVEKEAFAQTLATVGTLRANESVSLVPELSRRLVGIGFEEGEQVTEGQVLFKLDDSDLVAGLEEIKARIRLADANKARAGNLLPSKAISQQEYDLADAEVDILEAQKAAKEVEISKTEIRAPFAGRAGVRKVSEGALVSPATELIALQDVSRIKVDFPLPERYSGQVRKGQRFTFTVAGSATVFEGEVVVVEPAIDAATRSLQVRGLCPEPKGLLPGGFAEVRLDLEGEAEGFLVPSQAIVPSPRGQGVYVVEGGRADLKPVEIGMRTSDKVQVLRGISEGDEVVVTNLLRIRPGLEVAATRQANP